MKNYVLILLTLMSVKAYSWVLDDKIDSMTDEVTYTTYVTSEEGHRFSLVKKENDTIWGYLHLSGLNQFMINEELMFRVDKNKPKELSEEFEKLTYELGMGENVWEWNPSLIGFRLIPMGDNDSCGDGIKEINNGKKLVIRYHPNKSTYRDVHFDISKQKEAILKALKIDFTKC